MSKVTKGRDGQEMCDVEGKIVQYKLIRSLKPFDMTKKVNENLRLGWILKGHTWSDRDRDQMLWFCQVMVLVETRNE